MGGPIIVLIHGWPVTEYHWRHVRSELAAAGTQTLTWSPPGLGRPPSNQTRYHKSAIAEDLGAWLDAQKLMDVVLVGHDWGGTIAWMLTAQRPDLVSSLVVEEETFPGVDVAIPEPGASAYPAWHGPFNRAVGLAEALVPGNEDAYFGQFLRESAGPLGSRRTRFRTTWRPTGQRELLGRRWRITGRVISTSSAWKNSEVAVATFRVWRSAVGLRWGLPSQTACAQWEPILAR